MRSYGPCRIISLFGDTVEHLVFESRWTKGKWYKWYVYTFLHAATCGLISRLLSQNSNERITELAGVLPLITAAAAARTGTRTASAIGCCCCHGFCQVLLQHHLALGGNTHELPLRGSIPVPAALTVPHLQVRFQALWLYLCRWRYTCFSNTGCTSHWLQPFVMSSTAVILALPQTLQGSLLALGCVMPRELQELHELFTLIVGSMELRRQGGSL